jgi:hypothetical protein
VGSTKVDHELAELLRHEPGLAFTEMSTLAKAYSHMFTFLQADTDVHGSHGRWPTRRRGVLAQPPLQLRDPPLRRGDLVILAAITSRRPALASISSTTTARSSATEVGRPTAGPLDTTT